MLTLQGGGVSVTPKDLQAPMYGPDSLAAFHGINFLYQEHGCRAKAASYPMSPKGAPATCTLEQPPPPHTSSCPQPPSCCPHVLWLVKVFCHDLSTDLPREAFPSCKQHHQRGVTFSLCITAGRCWLMFVLLSGGS